MATAPLGRAYVEVKADLSGFATDVREKLKVAMAEGTEGLDFGIEEKLKTEVEQGAEEGGQELERVLPKHAQKAGKDSGASFSSAFSSAFRGVAAGFLPVIIALGVEIGAALLPAAYALAATIPAAITTAVAAAGTLALAFHGVGAAISAAFSGDPQKLAEAMKSLAPAARDFVNEINKARPAMSALQKDVQQTFFVQLEGSISRLVSNLLPTLHSGLVGIAIDLGKMGAGLSNALAGSKGDLGKIFSNMHAALQPLIPLLGLFAKAFLQIAAAAGPFVTTLSKGLADIATKFATLINNASQNGGLERLFSDALIILKDLGGLLGNVFGLVNEILGALSSTGQGALGTLSFIVGELRDFFATAEGNDALVGIFDLLNIALGTLGQILQPLLPAVGEFVRDLAGGLGDALIQLTPSLKNIAVAAADILRALDPLLPVVGELVKDLAPIINWITSSPKLLADAATAWYMYKKATEAATAAQIAFDVAEDANPIGAIVLAIEAIIAGIVLLVLNWKSVTKYASEAWNWIVGAWDKAWAFFVDLGKKIGMWFVDLETWFQQLPGRVMAYLESLPGQLLSFFEGALQGLADLVAYGLGYLVGWFLSLPMRIWNALQTLPGLLESFFTSAWNWVVNFTMTALDNLVAFVNSLPDRIVGAVMSLGPKLANFFSNAWDNVKRIVSQGADAVVDFARSLPSRLGNFFSGVGGSILNGLKGAINDVIRSFNRGIDSAAGPLHAVIPHIPYLAEGAIVKSPTLAMIGEGSSPEVVIPLGNQKRAQELAEQSGLTKMLLQGLSTPTINFTAVLGTGEILTILDQRVALANADTSQSIAFGARSS